MADILIRGMDMPKGCFYCPIGVEQYFTGSIRCPLLGKSVGYFDEVKNKRDMNCPLVPLPAGHGRLGDLNALYAHLHSLYHGAISDSEIKVYEALGMISNAPTIVPAEGGDN